MRTNTLNHHYTDSFLSPRHLINFVSRRAGGGRYSMTDGDTIRGGLMEGATVRKKEKVK